MQKHAGCFTLQRYTFFIYIQAFYKNICCSKKCTIPCRCLQVDNDREKSCLGVKQE